MYSHAYVPSLHGVDLLVCVLPQAFCEPAKVEGNGVLAFAKHVLFPILSGEGEWACSNAIQSDILCIS